MDLNSALIAFTVVFLGATQGAIFSRLNRIEARLGEMVTREEFLQLRQEVGAIRSDLTQVALAVGAHPRLTPAPRSK